MQGAIGLAQLKKLPKFIEARRQNFDKLKQGLSDLQDKLILPEACSDSMPSWFGFLITVKEGVDRNLLVQHLEENGIQTRMLFAGNLLKHPCFDDMRKTNHGFRTVSELKNTDIVMNNTFWIGVYSGMTDAKIDYMINSFKEFFNK